MKLVIQTCEVAYVEDDEIILTILSCGKLFLTPDKLSTPDKINADGAKRTTGSEHTSIKLRTANKKNI